MPLALMSYGVHGARGAWEIDHSIPVARGGTDHMNNLFPAHIACNRGKQARSSRSVRRHNGRTRAPLSVAARERSKLRKALAAAVLGGALGARFGGPAGFWMGAIVSGLGGYGTDPDDQR